MHRLEIRLLGTPQFVFDGAPWRFTAPPRALSLLAALLLRSGEGATRVFLATTLWPDLEESAALTNLRRHLYHLVNALPCKDVAWIDASTKRVRWNDAAPAIVDVREFERLAATPGSAAEAVEWYRGDLLESQVDEWIVVDRERLRDRFHDVLFEAAAIARKAKDYGAAARFAERILADDEWREDALRDAMSARFGSGDRPGALALFERFSRRLASELHVEPMPETLALVESIRANVPLSLLRDDLLDRLIPAAPNKEAQALPFLGRDEEYERLLAAWNRAARGSGSVVFVGGEAGIGKSRLALELARSAAQQGAHVLIGRTSNPEAAPYQTILSALRGVLALCAQSKVDDVWLSALAEELPEIYSLRGDLAPTESLEPIRSQRRLFEALSRVIAALARTKPILLLLEDVHWSGDATLELLGALARRVGTLPVLIVATHRSADRSETRLRAAKRRLIQEHRASGFVLAPLSGQSVEDIVNRAGIVDDVPPDLAPRIAELSGGNPLFATQLVYEYRESSELPTAGSAVRTVGDSIRGRLDRLSVTTRAIAQAASVVGESFDVELLADAGGWEEGDVVEAIDDLLDRNLVRETGGGAFDYTFTHALIGEALLETMTPKERATRHRRLAGILEGGDASDRRIDATVARHWALAGERARALHWYERAATAAAAAYAAEDAERYAREALAFADDDPDRFRLLLLLADITSVRGNVDVRKKDLAALAELAERLASDDARCEMLNRRQDFERHVGDRSAAHATTLEMLEIARRTGNRVHLYESLSALGDVKRNTGLVASSADDSREALELALAMGDRSRAIAMRQALVNSLVRAGNAQEAKAELDELARSVGPDGTPIERLALLKSSQAFELSMESWSQVHEAAAEALEIARAIGDLDSEGSAHAYLAVASHQRLDHASARTHYAETRRIGDAIGNVQMSATATVNLGVFELEAGRFAAAIELFELALPIARSIGARIVVGYALVNKADSQRQIGATAEALETAREAYAVAQEAQEKRLLASTLHAMGAAEVEAGSYEPAIEHIAEAVALRRQGQNELTLTDDLTSLADAYLRAERLDDARRVASEIETRVRDAIDDQKFPPRVCWVLARVAKAAGDRAGAFKWSERGKAIYRRRLETLTDPEQAEAYRSHRYNRELAAWS